MVRLLIADDEKIIRETLSTIIDWESMGVEVVAVCKDGLEAYDAIIDEYPDIVLTDIRMPKLSGLELIHKITENHDNIHFIILSGYDEFSYAKEAMRYGIKHYILKPCNELEIIHAVQDLIQEYYSVHTRSPKTESRDLSGNMMHHIFLQALSSPENLPALSNIYENFLDFSNTPYHLCYLYFIEEKLVPACIDFIQEFMKAQKTKYLFTYIYVKNTLLFFTENKEYDRTFLDTLLRITCKEIAPDLGSYHLEDYSNLYQLMNVLVKKTRRFEIITLYTGKQKTPICNYASLFEQTTLLTDQLISSHSRQDYSSALKELLTLIDSVRDIDLLHALANNILMKFLPHTSCTSSDVSNFILFVNSIHSGNEIFQFLEHTLDTLFTPTCGTSEKYKPFIQEILDYTHEHISDPNLTLKWIVENHLFMNVAYVSRQFVLQTGTKFSAYLNNLRIEKAKQLLVNCDSEKIYTVAEQVGCGNNPQYFSHLFKKHTKMTPKEYIQNVIKKGACEAPERNEG